MVSIRERPAVGLVVGAAIRPEVGPDARTAVGPNIGLEVGPEVGPSVGFGVMNEGIVNCMLEGPVVGAKEGAVLER